MKVKTRIVGNVLVVNVLGELDLNTAPNFRSAIEKELGPNPDITDILLIMKDITFMDSSGLGVILGSHKRLNAYGGEIIIAAPSPQVRKVFELSGLIRVISVYGTEDEAWAKVVGV
ncbi:MAG: anti-sigma factor antagonist [Firmicutes bacterium]|nr:anti-sigma factor antagonist [Bacillota bacterium]